MQRKSISLALAAACAALFAGCDWGSSSSESSWSGSYDAMNFGGTYRIATVALTSTTTTTTENSTNTNTNTDTSSTSESDVQSKEIGTTSSTETNYNGELNANIVPGSVSVLIGDALAFQDLNSNQTLTASGVNGTGTVTYSTGTIQFKLKGTIASGQKIVAYWRFYKDTTGEAGSGSGSGSSSSTSTTTTRLTGIDTTKFDKTNVTAITVSQTGQYVTVHINNGVTMTGRFTSVRQTGEIAEDTGAGANTFNAQFEVSGTNSRMVGTLNYDYPSHNRMLDGTWTYGNKVFDVHAVGPAWTESGVTTASEAATSN